MEKSRGEKRLRDLSPSEGHFSDDSSATSDSESGMLSLTCQKFVLNESKRFVCNEWEFHVLVDGCMRVGMDYQATVPEYNPSKLLKVIVFTHFVANKFSRLLFLLRQVNAMF